MTYQNREEYLIFDYQQDNTVFIQIVNFLFQIMGDQRIDNLLWELALRFTDDGKFNSLARELQIPGHTAQAAKYNNRNEGKTFQ